MINKRIKNVIADLLPPVVLRKYKGLSMNFRFRGNYPNWDQAKKFSLGYDSDIVLNKVKGSMLKVKNGEYAFERDSVLFSDIQYPFHVLAGLLKIALLNSGKLNVLDFGGSLGSSYYQCRNFLKGLHKLTWNIIEQPKFVACGKELFENEELKFYYNIDACNEVSQPDVVLLSGVVQYIENPYVLLEDIMKNNFKYLIFDRTAFLKKGPDRLAIQKIPAHIYNCSYPIWFLNYDNFVARLLTKYELITTFDTIDQAGTLVFFKGMMLKLRNCKI